MHADCGIAEAREVSRKLDGFLGFFKVGASDHQLATTCFESPLYDMLYVILVGDLAVMYATVDRVSQIYADLSIRSARVFAHSRIVSADKRQHIVDQSWTSSLPAQH